jgi:uncharacterized protein (DUF2141 family)
MTLIKNLAVVSTLGLLLPGPAAAQPAAAPAAASLTLVFEGIKTPEGSVLAALFDSEAAYGGKGPPVRGVAVKVEGGRASAIVGGLKPGRYALRAFHDLDGDGKMSTNPFGMPTEPFAFSNNAPAMMGPASWSAAAFEVPAEGAVHTITID